MSPAIGMRDMGFSAVRLHMDSPSVGSVIVLSLLC
jgi:hypothetical protein